MLKIILFPLILVIVGLFAIRLATRSAKARRLAAEAALAGEVFAAKIKAEYEAKFPSKPSAPAPAPSAPAPSPPAQATKP